MKKTILQQKKRQDIPPQDRGASINPFSTTKRTVANGSSTPNALSKGISRHRALSFDARKLARIQ